MSNIEEVETTQANEDAVPVIDGAVELDSSDRTPLLREFPAEITADGDGRTIDLRIVPYNTPAQVADPPHFRPYQESWLPGVFERQMNAVNRVKVLLNFEHEAGLRGVVGHGVSLQDHQDGPQGTFRVHANSDGDKALELVREGLLTGISMEAIPLSSRRVGDVVERVRAHLDKVALCRFPAFEKAEVLAVREAPSVVPPEPVAMPDEMTERLAALGIELLHRVTVVRKPWDGSAARFTDEEYQRSCLIDRGGDGPVKERCSLPVLEPNGDVNSNALGAAAGRLSALGNVSTEMKASAARKLVRFYRLAGMEAPPNVVRLASA
jgi:HK97 family phage prohead protease